MVGAAQIGVLAACVVLFVPMGLAGWHLSRNKMLFFSGALFISLAVGVHLAPFFPLLFSSLPPSAPRSPSCLPSLLLDIAFFPLGEGERVSPREREEEVLEREKGGFLDQESWSWSWSRSAASCGAQRISPSDASDLLNGSWVLIAGDSQSRLLALALLRLILNPAEIPAVESDLFRRHSDYQALVPQHGIKIDFVWAPYESNLTSGLLRELAFGRKHPDVLILGSGLWHMLHVTNSSDYGRSLVAIRKSAEALSMPDGLVAPRLIHMFWFGLPTLVNSKLNTEEKQEKLNRTMWEAYDREVNESGILRSSDGPMFYVDVGLLSQRCGRMCTEDGMHYDGAVYAAALHVMLNALLIDSQQRIEGGS